MVHAFFKALLFLGAGLLIWALNEEHNMFKMGGLWKKMPVVFWTFLIAASALAALPLITAGYFSKDKIIWLAYASNKGSVFLWIAAVTGAFITTLYSFRMVFVTFFGSSKSGPGKSPGRAMTIPLVVLALFSFGSGYIELPEFMGHVTLFSDFVDKTLPATFTIQASGTSEFILQLIVSLVTFSGLFIAYRYYFNKSFPAAVPQRNAIQEFFYNGWNFDLLYNKVIVQPMVFFSKINKNDFVDLFYKGLASVVRALNIALSASQTGKVRWYATVIAIGAILALTILFYP
jgi:NADH-quinone oxidoreductase subunit L